VNIPEALTVPLFSFSFLFLFILVVPYDIVLDKMNKVTIRKGALQSTFLLGSNTMSSDEDI